jgi:hypothetical protein
MKITRSFMILAVAITLTVDVKGAQQAQKQPKLIAVSVMVESEGPQGLWTQSSKDLSKPQLQNLERLIKAEVSKQPDVQLVKINDPQEHMNISVVAAQLACQGKTNWIVLSSAMNIARSQGGDLAGTHDVITGPDLSSVARSVAFCLSSIKLRAVLGSMR